MLFQRLYRQVLCVTTIVLFGQSGFAQVADLNETGFTTIESGLSFHGAPYNPLSVVATDEGDLFLISEIDGIVNWSLRFPADEAVNTAKSWISSNGDTIRVFSEFPFSSAQTILTFLWTGTGLSVLEVESKDPSYETVEKAIEWTAEGRDLPEGHLDWVGYPDRYIYDALITNAIAKGHAAAMKQYNGGHAGKAAERLAAMFDMTVSLIGLVGMASESEWRPEVWIESWQEMGIAGKDFIYALNDYGFFLQETGEHSSALPVFEKIIEIDPKRIVAYLNLADSQWELGNIENAKTPYRSYIDLMTAAGLSAKIPVRVKQRVQ